VAEKKSLYPIKRENKTQGYLKIKGPTLIPKKINVEIHLDV
jgi:hypothetical protein